MATTKPLPALIVALCEALEASSDADQHRRLIADARNACSEHLLTMLRETGAIAAKPGRTGAPRRHDHAAVIADAQRGLTVKQIATERGMPETTVRYVLARAREATG